MKNAMKKLKNRRGETLVETLVAVLVFTLSSVLMYSMAAAANNINQTARAADEVFQQQIVDVEQAAGTQSSGSVSVSLVKSPGSNTSKNMGSVNVDVYKSGDLCAYYVP